ncbi:hypothetical protein [Nocardioides bigeumensis]|uniref:Uncharacterized protein n=1 Tax=Nocardioides bigeumensis TaxID=433657 RepID=A0ABP5JR75_9ACTN
MTTALVAVFLIAHGLVHTAIWLTRPDPEHPAPFEPDHSALLTVNGAPASLVHRTSVVLAVGSAVLYVIAGVLVAFDAPGRVEVAAAAAIVGLSLKLLFFHPWLSLGVILDALVLAAAVTGWPVGL